MSPEPFDGSQQLAAHHRRRLRGRTRGCSHSKTGPAGGLETSIAGVLVMITPIVIAWRPCSTRSAVGFADMVAATHLGRCWP
jgi:hypothetical protein